MKNASFALLAVAILCTAGLAGVVTAPKDPDYYDEVEEFLKICDVPRMSEYNGKIGEYLLNFADEHGLYSEMDSVGNVLIDHPGTMRTKVILQTHMDMVAATDPGFYHDFTLTGIRPIINDGYITAEHTTLGADDGAGMAIALCALKSPELSGRGFRCIFTIDEETGMRGGKSLSAKWLEGYDCLINIDNETEGELLFGCAGSHRYSIKDTYDLVDAGKNQYRLEISGLLGGHSGVCINMNRANAILLAMDFLDGLNGVQFISFNSGTTLNSIPNSCLVVFSCTDDTATVTSRLSDCINKWNSTYSDRNIKASIESGKWYESAFSVGDSKGLITKVLSVPNGTQYVWEGYLIASSNLGTMTIENEKLSIGAMSRSAIQEWLTLFHEAFVKQFGDKVVIESENPCWFGDKDSQLFTVAKEAYEKITGKDAVVNITHGGMETGQFVILNPNIQIIALGPTIENAHTTSERISIESFHTTKVLVFEILKRIV